ncbi:MAG: type ISP restriction/modification enzyme [Tepidiformaceae bacterium]
MTAKHQVKPNHKPVAAYYEELRRYAGERVEHEGALRSAFQNLLASTAPRGWILIPELGSKVERRTVYPDGTLRDGNSLPRGYWEAKDTHDDLDVEIRSKIKRGYPITNTVFEDTRRAVLYQAGREVLRADLQDASQLCDLLNQFYAYTEPNIADFEQAVEEFRQRVPDLARGLLEKITEAHRTNGPFIAAFGGFFDLCKKSLNPNISAAAVDEMLVQHLLTERLFRTIFANDEFTRRNVIAAEIERVIDALISKSFNKAEFLKSLDRFYVAIEAAALTLEHFSDKQHFLNAVYEQFFQGYSVKVADTHGIVYTPQPIVDFMAASVAHILERDFGLSLGSAGVNVLDPATGTGNFIVNLLRRLPGPDLARAYRTQLFANEVMLLPYYIASLNIEHAFFELTGSYEPFDGLCFMDTLELAETNQTISMFSARNASRVEKERATPITVIIGNPPYNVGQVNENDNNKNRKYKVVDGRIKETYAKSSKATLNTKLYDPYVKFFRWAVDRLEGRDGIICLVTNNSFVDQVAFDGMRQHFEQDFTRIYHLDLGGNVRKDPKLSGTKHNVFGIQVGVGITVAVHLRDEKDAKRPSQLHYASVPHDWTREEKLRWLADTESLASVDWDSLTPTARHHWLAIEGADEWSGFLPLGTKETKRASAASQADLDAIFKAYSLGVSTNRDDTVYDFKVSPLLAKCSGFITAYTAEMARFSAAGRPTDLDGFLDYSLVKWSRNLKRSLRTGEAIAFDPNCPRASTYRPFTRKRLYFADLAVDELGQTRRFFPTAASESENRAIGLPTVGGRAAWATLVVNDIPNLNLTSVDGYQFFPLYVYDPDGSNRRDNITDWALERFRAHYADAAIEKVDIVHYVYGLLHHPGYRQRFGAALKRELPRIPFAADFEAFRSAGERLSALHLGYEQLQPYPLKQVQDRSVPFSWLVQDRMRLSKDRTSVQVNASLVLDGVPPEAFEYRLGNRSALEWVIDQYQVKKDKATGKVISDPNRPEDPEYIVRLVGQVVGLSLETVEIVKGLPAEFS